MNLILKISQNEYKNVSRGDKASSYKHGTSGISQQSGKNKNTKIPPENAKLGNRNFVAKSYK